MAPGSLAVAAPSPSVELTSTTRSGACLLVVRTTNAPRFSRIALERHREDRKWARFRTLTMAGRTTKRTTCNSLRKALVRAVLVRRKVILDISPPVRQRAPLRLGSRIPLAPPITPVAPVPAPADTPAPVPAPPADTLAPDTSIDSGPSGHVAQAIATFTYAGTPPGDTARFRCRLNDARFEDCSAHGWTTGTLPDGAHTFEVQAVDVSGNADPSPAARTWVVDTTPPDTTVDSGPPESTAAPAATFGYSALSGEAAPRFECSLDGEPFTACSPLGLEVVARGDGRHTFAVRAIDEAGNVDPIPATRSWRLDTTPPDTSVDLEPASRVADKTATFAYSGLSPADTARFECRVDGASFEPCPAEGRSVGDLADGPHTFEVRAVDAVGNADTSPATSRWTVDTTAPDTSIESGPAGRVAETSASFAYRSGENDPGDHFQCALDDEDFYDCAPGALDVQLHHGAHVFKVRAIDDLNNVDPTPAEHRFVVDIDAPDTTITTAPPEITSQRAFVIAYKGSPVADTERHECSVDGAAFAPCPAAGLTTASLPEGTHDVRVRAIDALGNVDPTPATHRWRVDTTAPQTSITEAPDSTTSRRAATFSYESPATDLDHFECALDAAAFTPCPSTGITLRGLNEGPHTFAVRAVDGIGNTDPVVASHGWTVDVPDPPGQTGTSSTIAELFPTTLRDAIPADGVDPKVGALAATGGFAIQGGATGTIGSRLSDGVTLEEGPASLEITPAGMSQAVGLAGDDAVLYDSVAGQDVAVRPTGDKGAEILSLLPQGTTRATYDLALPPGAELVQLSNGDVAIVDPGADPHPELLEIGQEIEQAAAEVVAASIESASDAADEAEILGELEEGYEELETVADLPVPPTRPERSELEDAAGEVPAYADPDATLAQVETAVERLESGLTREDLAPADVAAIETAEAVYAEAKTLADSLPELEERAVESAASKLFDQEMTADLADQVVEDLEHGVDADLDIGDSGAEQLRTAVQAVAAQSEVTDGRVIGLVSAPMAKVEGGDPIVSSLEVVDGSTVAVTIPPGVEGDVVADPFFVPVALFVARVAIQRVAPVVVRAAAQGARQVLSRAGSAANRVVTQVATKVRQVQSVVSRAASNAASAAQRALLQVRAVASTVARQAGARTAQAAARLRAQAAEAQRIAAEAVKRLQQEAKKAFDEARELGRRAREEVLRRRAEIAKEVETVAREQVRAAASRAITAGRDVRQVLVAAKDTLATAVREKLAAARAFLRTPAGKVSREAGLELADEALQAIEDDLTGDRILSSCLRPAIESYQQRHRPVDETRSMHLVLVADDIYDCVGALVEGIMHPGRSDEPNTGPSLLPTREELRQVLDGALADARRIGLETLASFPPPPLGAPERKAAVVGTSVPGEFHAGQTGFVHIAALNEGRTLPLAETFISIDGGGSFPYVHAGNVPGDGNRIVLTDENSDGRWDYGEVVNAIVEVRPPISRSHSIGFSYGFVSGGTTFSGGNGMTVNVRGPHEELRVYNQVTNGHVAMREDSLPVWLTTVPWKLCSQRGCNIGGTERWTDWTYHHAVCRTTGEWVTNGDDRPHATWDDGNPHRYSSNEYYGVHLGWTFGYVSWVWIHPDDRGGLNLPYC